MQKNQFWRSTMHASSIPADELQLALKVIQEPAKYPDSATKLQRLRIELIENWWRIYAWWIAYEQMLVDDICRKPYNTPSYQRARSTARVFSAKLKLCEQLLIFGHPPCFTGQVFNQERPLRAAEWWASCMRENKQQDVNDLFKNPEGSVTSQGISKDSVMQQHRLALQIMRDERFVPTPFSVQYPINSAVLKACLTLAWGHTGDIDPQEAMKPERSEFRNNYWNVYLEIYQKYIQDLKAQGKWKGFFEKDGKLFYYEQGKPRHLGFKAWHPTVQEWYEKL